MRRFVICWRNKCCNSCRTIFRFANKIIYAFEKIKFSVLWFCIHKASFLNEIKCQKNSQLSIEKTNPEMVFACSRSPNKKFPRSSGSLQTGRWLLMPTHRLSFLGINRVRWASTGVMRHRQEMWDMRCRGINRRCGVCVPEASTGDVGYALQRHQQEMWGMRCRGINRRCGVCVAKASTGDVGYALQRHQQEMWGMRCRGINRRCRVCVAEASTGDVGYALQRHQQEIPIMLN